jgi:protein-disulfide isomerase
MTTTRITIEVFSSPGCGKCGHAKEVLRKLVDELDNDLFDWREVNILDEIDHAVALGVMSTPSIAINGELVFTSLPTSKKLRIELERQLEQHS